VKQISDNEIHLLIKYIKSVLWRVAKRLSYIEDARYLKVKFLMNVFLVFLVENTSISTTSFAFIAQGSTGKHTVSSVVAFSSCIVDEFCASP